MGFKTYFPQRGPSSGKTTVRILRNGDLSISPGVRERWFGTARFVELLYDRQAGKVGMRPRVKATRATYKLRPSPQGGRRFYVSGAQFLDACGIRIRKARNHEAQWNEEEKLVEFSVK
jgi:hypothetical protein